MSNLTTLSERITRTKAGMKKWQQERAIFETTERICDLMEEQGVTRSRLARRLGRTKGYISQLLDGQRNMTIRTLSDVFLALDRAVHIHDSPISIENNGDSTIVWRCEEEDEHAIWGECGNLGDTTGDDFQYVITARGRER